MTINSHAKAAQGHSPDHCLEGQHDCAAHIAAAPECAEITQALQNNVQGAERDWSTATLTELIQHIVGRHHVYVRQALPRIQALLVQVRGPHADRRPELKPIASAFAAIAEEMTMHMMKEERMLFPYIVEMEKALRGEAPKPFAMFGTVENPVRMMMMEHDSTDSNIRGIRELSADYTVPDGGDPSFRELYHGLAEFESDFEQHIHLENDILFPAAIDLEQQQ